MKHKLADRIDKIQPSFTLQMATIAAELRAKGESVINFSVGEPDFNTPENIIDAGKKAMDQGYTKYTAGPGMIEFRQAICKKLKLENGLEYSIDEILVSNGEKQSLSTACQALFGQGDEVIVFQPYWVSFPEFIRLADAEPLLINTLPEKNFEPDFEELLSKDLKAVKGVILNSPSNPTGGVWGEEALIRMLKIAKKHNWIVISDECYERLVYDGEFTSTEKINQDHNINATVITCLSLSKTYSMTGWRIGYSAGPAYIIKAMAKIQGQATSCANSIGQFAGIEALTGSQDSVNNMILEFEQRRNFLVKELSLIRNVDCKKPGGAFYVFPKLKKNNLSSFEISQYLLEKKYIATVPGSSFGSNGEGFLRISYASSKENLEKFVECLKDFMNE